MTRTGPGSIERKVDFDELVETIETLSDNPADLVGATVSQTVRSDAFAMLERLSDDGSLSPIHGRLELGQTIGTGGMGHVRLARQIALGRDVAVKTLRDRHNPDSAAHKLLTEAWITGALEHPNITPIYDIGLDDQARPAIVMKNIEGTSWAELLQSPARAAEIADTQDLLRWHLKLLCDVCDAVHFAHNRGIIHRDIKPDNVMIGAFGELYLLDWGVAVALEDDGTGRLPLASDSTAIAGTPSYLAPEVVLEKPGDTRTDIYLLGGTLYEILAGHPPHQGENVFQVLRSALEHEPKLPSDVPEQLAQICRRALASDREQRFQSALEMKRAILGYLDHRSALELMEEASQRFSELRQLLEAGDQIEDQDDAAIRLRAYKLFAECRFAYQRAATEYPEGDAARELQVVAGFMARYELERGDPEAAAAVLAEVEEINPALLQAIESLREDRDRRDEELARLIADRDRTIGAGARYVLAIVLSGVWLITPITHLIQRPTSTYEGLTTRAAVFSVVISVILFIARKPLLRTAYNRAWASITLVAAPLWFLLAVISWKLDIGATNAQLLIRFIWIVITLIITLTVDRRMVYATAAFTASVLIPAFDISLRFEAMFLANLVLALNILYIFWPRDISSSHREGLQGYMSMRTQQDPLASKPADD